MRLCVYVCDRSDRFPIEFALNWSRFRGHHGRVALMRLSRRRPTVPIERQSVSQFRQPTGAMALGPTGYMPTTLNAFGQGALVFLGLSSRKRYQL
uniref:Protein of unassigned function n=1 Tax=Ascaris lumbricoides TaxID=6252 RepID=A0A0M3I0P3_ASCLU